MGRPVLEAVSSGQIFEFEARGSIRVLGPLETVRAQCVKSSDNIDKVPTAVSAAVFPRIGIVKITSEAVPRDFVVKAQRVIPDTAGAWLR